MSGELVQGIGIFDEVLEPADEAGGRGAVNDVVVHANRDIEEFVHGDLAVNGRRFFRDAA